VTLREVAVHAGVSVRTVSNVVNDYPYVSVAMRTKVQASLDELNYRPNLLARSLRAGRSGIITLLVPDIATPYFGELAHEVVEQASELGCTVMIDETGGIPERERALLDVAARSSWVDGVLLSSLGLFGKDLEGIGEETAVVLLGERVALTTLDHVGFDNVAAAREATDHLLAGGRTRVAVLGGDDVASDATTRLRLEGYRQSLAYAGLAERARHGRTVDYRRDSARAGVRTLWEAPEPPDAVLCLSDELAAGALRELYEQAVRVPDDVALVGFDDSDGSRFLTPSLTSVRQDRAETARAALEVLLRRIGGSDDERADVVVPHELVVRESSAAFVPR
jgi:DNA-binding LacI/PurR family transcriptional regulator